MLKIITRKTLATNSLIIMIIYDNRNSKIKKYKWWKVRKMMSDWQDRKFQCKTRVYQKESQICILSLKKYILKITTYIYTDLRKYKWV